MEKDAPLRTQRANARPLAELVNRTLDPLIARQGFGETALFTQWEAIVGARISALCEPERMIWPRRAKKTSTEAAQQPATLALRVEPGFGLDIQHLSGAIMERVNAHLGWRCVARVAIRQEALRRAAPKRPQGRPLDPAARALATEAAQGIEHEALRAALIALGERVLSQGGG
jgi:hypothetical protein